MRQMLYACLSICLTGISHAQVGIGGRVTDEQGVPLTGANVFIDQSYRGSVTDADGTYRISNLKPGSYVIGASYIGYNTVARRIALNRDTTISFELRRANYLADEVIVSATRAGQKAPVAYTDISREEIQERNNGQDLPYLLNLSPSFVTTSDAGAGVGYTNLRIRGTDLNRINVTIDGIPLNDAESHGLWFVDLPDLASSLENVQIQRGVGTSTNGAAAFGATMNFQTTKLNQEPYAEWNTSIGSFNTWKNTVGLGTGMISEHFSLDLRLSKIDSDGYIDRAGSNLKSFFLSGGYYSERTIVKVNVFTGIEKTYLAWNGVPADSLEANRTFNPSGMLIKPDGTTGYYENETDNYQQDHYHLHFSQELGPNLIFNSGLHYTYGRGYYEEYRDKNIFPWETYGTYGLDNMVRGDDTLTRTDLIRQKWLKNDFYGLIYSLNYKTGKWDFILGGAANRYDGNHFGKIIWARFPGTMPRNYEWYRGTGLKTDISTYLKVNHKVSGSLTVFADLQYRNIRHRIDGLHDNLTQLDQDHTYHFLNPKVGAAYELADHHNVYISLAQAHREPNRSNFVDADPAHPVPKAETLTDFETGYRGDLRKMKLEANLYYMDYANQLVLTGELNNVGAPVMTNIPESYRTGIELVAGVQAAEWFSWDGNVTLSRNRIESFTEYVDNYDYWGDPENEPYQLSKEYKQTDISFSPQIIAGSRIIAEPAKNLSLRLLSKYTGSQYMDNTSSPGRKLDAYFVNDLIIMYSIETSLAEKLTMRLMISNILNELYESNAWVYRYIEGEQEYDMIGYYPQAGRHFTAGMTLRF